MGASTLGKTRSEQERNLASEGYNTLTEEQLDKCEYMEKKLGDATGSKHNFISQSDVDKFNSMGSVERRDELGHIRSSLSSQGKENYKAVFKHD